MKRRTLRFELLETRQLLTGWGSPWPEPERLTLSLVPDGTNVAGQTSRLFELLDGFDARSVWQHELLRAFQTWAQYTNINFSVVEDAGNSLGAATPSQGDPQWGDIRIAAVPLSHAELAVASPFDLFNNWSGEVLLNSGYRFQCGEGDGYDLYTVLLQEAGHALSLANSADPTSAMYTVYSGARSGLAPTDIATITSLYGTRTSDRFEGAANNDEASRATQLQFVSDFDQLQGTDGAGGPTPFVAAADLTAVADVDFYRVALPHDLHDFHVELRASGISLLSARLAVYDSAFQLLGEAESFDPLAPDVSLFISDATPGEQYFVRVEGAADNPFGVGAYRMSVGKEAREAVFPAPTSEYINDDRGDDDDDDTGDVVNLIAKTSTVGPLWDVTYRASVSFPTDDDYYRIVAPSDAIHGSTTLHLAVWGLEPGELDPVIRVYSDPHFLRQWPTEVLLNDADAMALQIVGVVPGRSYYVKVGAADPQNGPKQGNYLVGADFRTLPVAFAPFAGATLSDANPERVFELQNLSSQVHHLRLNISSGRFASPMSVTMTIYDAEQREVATIVAGPNAPRTTTVLLRPGRYTVRVLAVSHDAATPLPTVSFEIAGVILTDPIGPILRDPTFDPIAPSLPRTNPRYWWKPFGRTVSWFDPRDPHSDPWYKF